MDTPATLVARWSQEDDRQIDSAIEALFMHINGRRFIWHLLEITGVNRNPYAGNALSTAFNCGEMNIGQRFLERMISVSPEGYVNMLKEMADERRERDGQLAVARGGSSPEPDFGGEAGGEG